MMTIKKIVKLLPARTKLSSKIDGGKVLIIGGGAGLYGAGILSALAATRSGAGYTHLMTDLCNYPWDKFPDFIIHPLKLSELKNKENYVIGIGPGLGLNGTTVKLVNYLIKHEFKKVVVDADALSVIADAKKISIPASWIFTPHEGELARLLHTTSAYIKKNREKSLMAAYEKFGCTIILKGAETLIISPETEKIVKVKNTTSALAKAGTGDVLLGIISGLRAQGLTALEASTLGCFLHGEVAKNWLRKKRDHLSLRPMDLIEGLPETIYKVRGTR